MGMNKENIVFHFEQALNRLKQIRDEVDDKKLKNDVGAWIKTMASRLNKIKEMNDRK